MNNEVHTDLSYQISKNPCKKDNLAKIHIHLLEYMKAAVVEDKG